jgi:hypothetical protein
MPALVRIAEQTRPHIRWYSDIEVALIRSGVMHIPGRTYAAVKSKRISMGLNDRPPPFTAAETAAIEAGATTLPGRSRSAVKSKRHRMGLNDKKPRPYSAEELAAVQRDRSKAVLLGRSRTSIRCKSSQLGLSFKKASAWVRDDVCLFKRLYEGGTPWSRICKHFSYRTRTALRGYAANHKWKRGQPDGVPLRSRWTPEQSAKLLELASTHTDAQLVLLLGRTEAAITNRRHLIGIGKVKRWTSDENSQLCANPALNNLPGRTARAVATHRRRCLQLIRPSPAQWTPVEDCALMLDSRSPVIEGRSASAIKNRRSRLGLTILAAAIPWSPAPQKSLWDLIRCEVPRHLPSQIRDEIIQEVALSILEGKYRLVNVREAVKAATKAVHRIYPTLGAPVSLDVPMFGDGSPLIERISEGLW